MQGAQAPGPLINRLRLLGEPTRMPPARRMEDKSDCEEVTAAIARPTWLRMGQMQYSHSRCLDTYHRRAIVDATRIQPI